MMEPILIGPEKAALESMVATGKVSVPVPGRWEYIDGHTARQRMEERDATLREIEVAKRRLRQEEARRRRVEAERRERERLRLRAEKRMPELQALREAQDRLAEARAEHSSMKEMAGSAARLLEHAQKELLRAEASHVVGDLSKAAVGRYREEADQARLAHESVQSDLERSRLIVSRLEAKVDEASREAERAADALRSLHVESIREHLREVLEIAGVLEELEREFGTVFPKLRSMIDHKTLHQIRKWAE